MTTNPLAPDLRARLCAAALIAAACATPALAADVVRHKIPGSDFPIAMAVEVPAGKKLVFLSGGGPSVVDKAAPPNSVAAFGDTLAQTVSTMESIKANLKALKLEMKDVVKMQVFLVGDPAKDGAIDFAGFMEGYRKYFGGAQPNLPARSTVKVAGLVNPGWLVEIEVTAVAPE
ncbi:MAG TPA: RidA family protein [Burkholderiaceae bacterium]|nr:RidA family protein [Burkholderiaceae bacterium]